MRLNSVYQILRECFLVIPVYDVLNHNGHHQCEFDIGGAGRDSSFDIMQLIIFEHITEIGS